jgi:hypothetical protein
MKSSTFDLGLINLGLIDNHGSRRQFKSRFTTQNLASHFTFHDSRQQLLAIHGSRKYPLSLYYRACLYSTCVFWICVLGFWLSSHANPFTDFTDFRRSFCLHFLPKKQSRITRKQFSYRVQLRWRASWNNFVGITSFAKPGRKHWEKPRKNVLIL